MAAILGESCPVEVTAALPDQVPPGGEAVRLMAPKVLHNGGGMVKVGVMGLLMVTARVWVTGQG
ncbi:MAG: hypothetical protein EBY15_10185 [Gammaproteobacteria bacterium]|jgi:hypothetical protein|nr:hypothetical protein [Gammaproteobacteria bacterium]